MSRFVIRRVTTEGPANLRATLPVTGRTLSLCLASDGREAFVAVLDEPLNYEGGSGGDPSDGLSSREVRQIVFCARGTEAPHHGMRNFAVDLGYLLEPLGADHVVDLSKVVFVAVAEIDDDVDDVDVDHTSEHVPPPVSPSVAVPPPVPPPAAVPAASPSAVVPPPVPRSRPGEPLGPGSPSGLGMSGAGAGEPPVVPPSPEEVSTSAAASVMKTSGDEDRIPAVWPDEASEGHGTLLDWRATDAAFADPDGKSGPFAAAAGVANSLRTAARRAISDRPNVVLALGSVAAVLLVGIGLMVWVLRPSSEQPATQSAPTPTTSEVSETVDVDDAARILVLLPRGYAVDNCTVSGRDEGRGITATCGPNTDPGGPLSGRYTLFEDRATLDAELSRVVDSSRQMNCPGDIQSPGPWRKKTAPEEFRGTVFCGIRHDRPIVAWTDTPRLLLSVVESGPGGPNMQQLYSWWTSHS